MWLLYILMTGIFYSFFFYQDRYFKNANGLIVSHAIYNGLVSLLYILNGICCVYFLIYAYTTFGFSKMLLFCVVSFTLVPILVSFLLAYYSHLTQTMISFFIMPLSLFMMDFNKLGIVYVILAFLLLTYAIFNMLSLGKSSVREKNNDYLSHSNKSSQPEQPHLVQIFYDNGNLKSEVTFLNDKMNGELKLYYENGNIATKINYDDGIKNGEEVTYYVNGQIKSQGYYKNGKKDGVIKEYLQDGKLASETTYLNGVFSCKNVYVEETAINKNKIEQSFRLYNPVFGKLYSLSGRMNRLHFFIYSCLYIFTLVLCALIIPKFTNITQYTILYIVLLKYFILLPLIAKRFHDLNISVVFYVVYSVVGFVIGLMADEQLLPTVERMFNGIDGALIFLLLFKKGTEGNNKYGCSPL